MKKHLISRVSLLVACTLLLEGSVFAQDSKQSQWEWKAGVAFAPQANWDFKNTPIQVGAPLSLVTTLLHKKWAFTTFYNTSNNNQGLLINYQLEEKVGVFGVLTKSYAQSGGYTSIGVGTPLGNATGFFEVGTSYGTENNFSPTAYFGVFIPFSTTIKKW